MIDFFNNRQQIDSSESLSPNSREVLAFPHEPEYNNENLYFFSLSGHQRKSQLYQGAFFLLGIFFLGLVWWISQQGISFFFYGTSGVVKGSLYLFCTSLAALNLFVAWQMRGFREMFRMVCRQAKMQLLAVRNHREQGLSCENLQSSLGYQDKVAAFFYNFHKTQKQSEQRARNAYQTLVDIESSALLTNEAKQRLIFQTLIDLRNALNDVAVTFEAESQY
jgi:hypothetical protein